MAPTLLDHRLDFFELTHTFGKLFPKMADKIRGTVKWFNQTKGFGFIESNDKDYFIHFNELFMRLDFYYIFLLSSLMGVVIQVFSRCRITGLFGR